MNDAIEREILESLYVAIGKEPLGQSRLKEDCIPVNKVARLLLNYFGLQMEKNDGVLCLVRKIEVISLDGGKDE